ncbi:IMPACT family protein [Porphyromonas cangingivalis]|uniref:IMPACT family protein n=1 Tax=Porphyromonas cangingivalis TaxID=36874 RepID=UPI003F737BD8
MHIEAIRKEYYDARHVCWAYVCGEKSRVERLNDDGEPSSTAGKPILGQIHSKELTNTLVVVIRYFGGVKLGTGGSFRLIKRRHSKLSMLQRLSSTSCSQDMCWSLILTTSIP